MNAADYDPFGAGPFGVGVRTTDAPDHARGRIFPCELWYPAQQANSGRPDAQHEMRAATALPGPYPLIVFSHFSGGHRRSSSFLCKHLAGHGYVVAALDHSEVAAPELAPADGETGDERAARIDAVIASRVPDVRFLLGYLLEGGGGHGGGGHGHGAAGGGPAGGGAAGGGIEPSLIGLAGHSFGGWTVLATPEAESRVRSVVALAPGGSSHPLPGILPLKLTFAWGREVPTLYLAADQDTPIPLAGVRELFGRTPSASRMFILRRADHQHFVDNVEADHEALRAMSFPGPAGWIPAAMSPASELCTGEQAHIFVRGLTLAHFDATLRRLDAAERFLAGDPVAALAARGVEAAEHRP